MVFTNFYIIERGTIVFDLDETLAHCVTDESQKADQQITVTLPSGEKIKAGVNIRPCAVECLTELAKDFELIVFTASHPYYAERVIGLLDPEKKLFAHRLFRTNCIKTDSGFYIKDLRILNRDLASVVIVDNSILSFAFQLDNGIPIIPFYDDKEDRILPTIKNYLLGLKDLDDFRKKNRQTFSLKELYDLNVHNFLKYYCEDDGSDDDFSGDSFDNSLEEIDAETATGEEDLVIMRRKSMSSIGVEGGPKIGRRAQAAVESELGKLRAKLPQYLAGEQKGKSAHL